MPPQGRKNTLLSEILRRSVRIYTQNFHRVCLISAIVYVPVFSVINLLPIDRFGVAGDVEGFILLLLAGFLLWRFFAPLAVMSNAYITYSHEKGTPATFSEAMQQTFSSLGTMMLASFSYLCSLTTFLMLTAVPILEFIALAMFINFYVVFGFYGQAIILNGRKGISSLLYSQLIVKGNWNWIKSLSLRLLALSFLIFTTLGVRIVILPYANNNLVAVALASALPSILNGFFDIALTLLYLNIHKEKGIEEFLIDYDKESRSD